MTHLILSVSVMLCVSLGFSQTVPSWGTWLRSDDLSAAFWSSRPIMEKFVLLKAGVFSSAGSLKKALSPQTSALTCTSQLEWHGWVTHRLSPGEVLSATAGKKLGSQLNELVEVFCLKSIELDIEPLPKPPAWLESFVEGVRNSLKKGCPLRLAVPPVSSQAIPGHHWSASEALRILAQSDGLDFMIYDTGLTDSGSYQAVIRETVRFAGEALVQFPTKSVVLGFPAYQDRTRLHRGDTENLRNVMTALKALSQKELRAVCLRQISLAYYAAWTRTDRDRAEAEKIAHWRNQQCGAL